MGTTSSVSSLFSALATSAATTAPQKFTGVSTFSNDLQSVLSRALAIGQLPITALQNDQADLEAKVQALGTLNPLVAAVGKDIAALGSFSTGGSLSATSSNPALVSVMATGATSAASYTISDITSIGSAASGTSANSYSDASTTNVSSAGNLQLVVGSNTYNLNLSSTQNNLTGLVNAINGIPGGPVTASILTTQHGNYLSLSANSTGAVSALQLNDVAADKTTTNLLATSGSGLNLGSDANFQLNGVSISQSNNTVNSVVPGLTFTILGTTSATTPTVNLTLGQDSSKLTSALQTFVTDYNSLLSAVNGQVGLSDGALTGNTIMYQIESAMQQAVMYDGSGSSSVKSLYNLGIQLDYTGKMSFDPSVVTSMNPSQLSDALGFLGSSSSGFGALASSFTQISDPISGLIKTQSDSYNKQDQSLQDRVTAATDRLTSMQTALQSQLEATDAALAGLQSQQQLLTSSIQSIDLATYGQNYGTALTSQASQA